MYNVQSTPGRSGMPNGEVLSKDANNAMPRKVVYRYMQTDGLMQWCEIEMAAMKTAPKFANAGVVCCRTRQKRRIGIPRCEVDRQQEES
jgi:hypothetical protein